MLKLLDTTTIKAEESDKDGCPRCSGKVRYLILDFKTKSTICFFHCHRFFMRRELKSTIKCITRDVPRALIAQNLCPQRTLAKEKIKTYIAFLATLEFMELQGIEVKTL